MLVLEQGEHMSKRNLGIAIIAFGGLVYATAIIMGLIGFPRPGWGYYKIPLAIIGIVISAIGILFLERNLKNKNDIQNNNRYFLYGCILNLVLSIFPRLPFLEHISSWWRSSHTLLTSLWFQKEGISLFNYQTPVFGPPWQVPLEFPLYQAICTLFSNITSIDLTLSSRLMSLAIFYLSALLLMLLCLEFIESKSLCLIILTVYLWLPFNIRYSTEILPDFLSVTLALSYLYWIYKWLVFPRNYLFFVLAVLSGCLGAVVKITTMPIVMVPAILMTLNGMQGWGISFRESFPLEKMMNQVKSHKLSLFLLAGIVVLPLVSAILWVKFEDGIKQANIYTAWFTSTNSSDWWFGTLSQKLSYSEWIGKFTNIQNYFLFGAILIFPILGIVCLNKLPLKSRCVFGSALTGALLTIFIFFNLYFHEYYYIAVAAFISVLIGFGIYWLYKYILQKNIWWHVISGIVLLFIIMNGYEKFAFILSTVKNEVNYTASVFIPLAKKVAEITPENEYIISIQDDWYPEMMLFSQRKGLIIAAKEGNKYTCESITKYKYTTIVVVNRPDTTPEEIGLLGCFKNVELIEPGLYKVEP
jgi:hypothetical protein